MQGALVGGRLWENEVIALIKERILRAEVPVGHQFRIQIHDGHYVLGEEGG